MTVTPIFTLNSYKQYGAVTDPNDQFVDIELAEGPETEDRSKLAEIQSNPVMSPETPKAKTSWSASKIAALAFCLGGLNPLCWAGCSRPRVKASASESFINISQDGKRITFGRGKQRIVFSSFKMRFRIDKDIADVKKLYRLISETNTLIPSMPMQKVIIIGREQIKNWKEEGYDPFPGAYIEKTHELVVGFYPNYIETLFHEAGHAVFRVLLGGKAATVESGFSTKDEQWQKIYYLTFAYNNAELVTDSTYIESKKGESAAGHPRDSASELFASSFMIYKLYPNEFLKKILASNVKKETRRFGKLIYIYLRDRIFKGRFYSASDPFRGEPLSEIDGREILNSLCLSAGSENLSSSSYARTFITSRPSIITRQFSLEVIKKNRHLLQKQILRIPALNKETCMEPLRKAFGSNEYYIRAAAARGIGAMRLTNENLFALLTKTALNDNNPKARAAAAKAIGSLGIKGEITVTTLIKALGDSDPDVRIAAAIAIGWLRSKDKRFVAPLIKALKDPNPKVRATAASTIEWFGIKDKRFIVPLIRAASDSDPDTRANAIEAIGELGIKNKKIIKLLIQAMADNNRKVRAAAASAIGDLGLKEKKIIALLIKALSDTEFLVRLSVIRSLGKIGDKKIILLLKKKLADPNVYIKNAVKKAIKEIENRENKRSKPLK